MGTKCTLREIFKEGFEAYCRTRGLLPFQLKAGLAILRCRTAELGGHVKRCPAGCVEKVWYNSCRHRACPLCAWVKIHQWLETIRARLLPIDHYHTTFTLPGDLRIFWEFDRKAINDLMFKIARTTLFNALKDPEHLGAKPGILMSLHTWARDLWSHVHVHCLVTGGGITADGRWKPCGEKFLVPQEVLRHWFRERFAKALRRMINAGKIELPPDMCRFDALCRLTQAERKEWIVDIEHRDHGHGVAEYLARYVRGGPLKESRLLSFVDDTVTFRVSRKDEPCVQRQLDLPVVLPHGLMLPEDRCRRSLNSTAGRPSRLPASLTRIFRAPGPGFRLTQLCSASFSASVLSARDTTA
ncbi:MAG: transposase [bacterium]|nr:transposase [bacterium]